MSVTAIEGVVAAGRVPLWIIPAAAVTTPPSEGTPELPLADVLDATSVKADCYFDAGDVSVTRSPLTKTRQRMCQVNAQTINVGETIDMTITAVFDQQAGAAAEVNEVYAALPDGAEVYIVQAWGWDSADTPTVATIVDVAHGTVQSRLKNQPTTIDEDLKFSAAISVDYIIEDVELTA